jgi:cytochrome c-type biogenesis protein CcmF
MLFDLGYPALALALGIALGGIFFSVEGARRGRADIVAAGRNAVYVVGALVLFASVLLWLALLTSQFQLEYVASHTERSLSLFYKFSAFWGGQAGSLLFWTLLLSAYSVLAMFGFRHQYRQLMPYVAATLLLTSAFFLFVLLFAANPFQKLSFVPADGTGLNPLLQNYWMVIHPVALYLGFVGFAVPFAFAVAALVTRQLGNQWVRSIRRWTLVPWLFLSVGILMGSQWAYIELGWGGYWAWDAVENASLLPWLTATAFLHSIVIQERRGMLKVWNMVLIFLTYELVLIGTFITRSGIIESVHSFALSNVGPVFLAFIALTILGYLWLLFSRLPLLRSDNELDSMLSRESGFLFNNVIFVGIAFATFFGTTFPMFSEMLTGSKISVAAPWFNKVTGPLFVILLILMGVGPLLGWRRSSRATLRANLMWPVIVGVLVPLVMFVFGVRDPLPLVGFGLCSFVVAGIVQEFSRGARARRHATGEGWGRALVNLTQKNQRRYGGYIVHLGIVMIALGIIGNTYFQTEAQGTLAPGETLRIDKYVLTFEGLRENPRDTHTQVVAEVAIDRDGRDAGFIWPRKNLYFKNPDQPTTEVGLRIFPTEDLYVVLAGWQDGGQAASLKVYVNPLMSFMWLGGLTLILGTVIAMWPHATQTAARTVAVPSRTRPSGV